jgi:DNA-binding beta-propeller fold protein YncE
MYFRDIARSVIGALALIATAACNAQTALDPSPPSAAATRVQPARTGGWLSPEAQKPGAKIYISDFTANVVNIYKPTGGAPIGSITQGISGPMGTWIDASGTLYVTNNTSSEVTEYRAGSIVPTKTLTHAGSGGLDGPSSIAVGSNGTVYVAGDGAGGTAYAFAPSATTPSVTWNSPSSSGSVLPTEGIAVDSKSRPYLAYWGSQAHRMIGSILRFEPMLKRPQNLDLTGVDIAGDVKFDSHSNLLVGDQGLNIINVYAWPALSSFPTRTLHAAHPFRFALNPAGTILYVAVYNYFASVPLVQTLSYPSGKPLNVTFEGLKSATGVSVSTK